MIKVSPVLKEKLAPLIRKSIAIGSGKGGVGKTTIATNLAIYYAKKGLRVGLIDIDPLSDISTLLDLSEGEQVVKQKATDYSQRSFFSFVSRAFSNLDLIFPMPKLAKNESTTVLLKIYLSFAETLYKGYDILIFDLPAGVRYEDNLIFLHFVSQLIIVTNAEPTAHVAAGEYVRTVIEMIPQLSIHFWHNKYELNPSIDFDPKDVIGNYNRNVPIEIRIDRKKTARIRDLAFIPKDPSLDLLASHSSITINVLRNILDLLNFLLEQQVREVSKKYSVSGKMFELTWFFLKKNEQLANPADTITQMGGYLGRLTKKAKTPFAFTARQKQYLTAYIKAVKKDLLRTYILDLIVFLEGIIQEEENHRRPFFFGNFINSNKRIDKKLTILLLALNKAHTSMPVSSRYIASLVFFYFGLLKLFQSRTMTQIVSALIPRRQGIKGRKVRDRRQQIYNLVNQNNEYRKKYFRVVKTLFPVITGQLMNIARTLEIMNLLFKTPKNTVNRLAYLKLFSNFIHETVNSGLGVVVGFRHRPAARAFHKSAEELLLFMKK